MAGPLASATSAQAATCPNEDLRIAQHTTELPECRAFERVSPEDKNSADINGEGLRGGAQAALDGNSIAYVSLGAFSGSHGGGLPNTYVARRNAQGWPNSQLNP
ncbi:MAG TPA: hypothetical protein VFI03_08540, partial [Solirubrobacterales bacterium]|nr:hypothetical protein [Solirubrobacterales bacterium]